MPGEKDVFFSNVPGKDDAFSNVSGDDNDAFFFKRAWATTTKMPF